MLEQLNLPALLKELKQIFDEFPDARTGKNSQYEMADAGLGAFSVFFIQCASFLEHQEELKRTKGRSNAESLFGMMNIPSDNQIRGLLDPIAPNRLAPLYRIIFQRLEHAGFLEPFRSHANHLLIAIDGTEYFSSQKIHCPNCNHRELANGKTNYFHRVLTPVMVQAGTAQVISLEPEFITPQDGHDKQDCELAAGKRWLSTYGDYYAQRKVTILGDDLFSRQPFCQALTAKKLHFILVGKPDSHVHLYECLAVLAAQEGGIGTYRQRVKNGKQHELYTYRYASQVPLRHDPEALRVNWVELTLTQEETGEVIYQNAFLTDFEVRETTVEAIVRDGRARWKVENENNNVLKTKGYHLEHNFGHGTHYLASLLLSLNLLAFLFHTVLGLVDNKYRLLRQALRKRQKFFQDIETLLQYLCFDSWEALWLFMCKGLELDTS